MNICFVANFSKTMLFDAIARNLMKDGETDVFWIVVNKPLQQHLEAGYGKERVLYISKQNADLPQQPAGEYAINELLYGDRSLRYEMDNGARFLTNIQKPIADFLRANHIKCIIGEQTWAHEVLTARIARSFDILYTEPQVARIPNGRFIFFDGESTEHLVKMSKPDTKAYTGIFKIEKPDYLKINDVIVKNERSVAGRAKKIKRFFNKLNDHTDDPSIAIASVRMWQRIKEELNKETYRFVKRTPFEEIKDEKYVLHTLHKQPENSIDVYGRYYEDQYLNIVNIWRKLPVGWKLVIKEHTNAIGDRELNFYKSVSKLPGVVLVNEKTDSYRLITHAQLVITITGTIAYEAALMKVPSITFSKLFFNKLNYCAVKTLNDLKECHSLNDWVEEIKTAEDNREEFCRIIMENSFPGTFTDPVTLPSCMDEDNIRLLEKGFRGLLETISLNDDHNSKKVYKNHQLG